MPFYCFKERFVIPSNTVIETKLLHRDAVLYIDYSMLSFFSFQVNPIKVDINFLFTRSNFGNSFFFHSTVLALYLMIDTAHVFNAFNLLYSSFFAWQKDSLFIFAFTCLMHVDLFFLQNFEILYPSASLTGNINFPSSNFIPSLRPF